MWRIWRAYCGVTRGARNVRPVQGNHQECEDEIQLLSTSDHTKPCIHIVCYSTTDHDSPSTKSPCSSPKSIGVYRSTHYEHKNVNYLPEPPTYKWGSDNHHKESHRYHFYKDVNTSRWCKRQRRQQLLLTYSVLQAFGWGSVLALSWTIWKGHSLYHHSKQHCPADYLSFQTESSNVFFNNEAHNQLLRVCENNENAKNNQENYSSFNQCYNNEYIFNPDIDRSLFSCLYSVASNQPVIKSNVQDKKKKAERATYKKRILSLPPDFDISTSEGHTHSQSYSQKLNAPDTSLHQSDINLQQPCLSQNCENSNDVPCVCDKETVIFEDSASETGNDQFSTNIEAKTSKEIVTIEDCSESGISSSNSNEYKKIDASKNEEKAEDIQKIIEREIKAIREVQDNMNGLVQRDLGLSLIDIDPGSAILHFQAGALLGDSDATYNLALCLHMGKGVKKSYRLARKYYSEASKAGHAWATYNLAVLVSEGLGGVEDNDLAYALLQTAAERGVEEAKEALRVMEEEEEEDDDNEETVDIGMIASSQLLPTMNSEHSEIINSPILDHFEALSLSRDLSLTL